MVQSGYLIVFSVLSSYVKVTKRHVKAKADIAVDIAVVRGWSTHTAYDKKVIISCMRRIAYDKVKAL